MVISLMRLFLFLSWLFVTSGFCTFSYRKVQSSRWLSNTGSDNTYPTIIYNELNNRLDSSRKYPFSQKYFERYIKRLNSKNITQQTDAILEDERSENENEKEKGNDDNINDLFFKNNTGQFRIIINKNVLVPYFDAPGFEITYEDDEGNEGNEGNDSDNEGYGNEDTYETYKKIRGKSGKRAKKSGKRASSDHFEIVEQLDVNFTGVGGYDSVKLELDQCIDILQNSSKYAKYNVRTPKGLIFEGPPGNGKTLLAKALAGEAKTNFIAVSGAEFQDKYVGVGPSKIRELFKLAKDNIPCIIFIDEIDALGRSRSGDGESSSAERDNTLNELLVALDGFKNTNGIFVIGATNRADLLDGALLRPGRIDKRIFIGNPDEKTREAILKIHCVGKPREPDVSIPDLVDITAGFSGAQIENLLNEAMLHALRYNRHRFSREDIDTVCNKILVGWQPTEHRFTTNIIDHIAIHEMGHAIVGLLSKHHSKVTKVVINLSAPTSPGYTMFENSNSNIYTREALFEHLMILLGGRIAEEEFWGVSVTTGAINDFEEVLKLAHKMITHYGMGQHIIYPTESEKYKEMVDDEIYKLIKDAYAFSQFIIGHSRGFIFESSELLKTKKTIRIEELNQLIHDKYSYLLELKIE